MRIQKVFSFFKKISDGAHGNTSGFHGSLTPQSTWKILNALDVFGRSVEDIGAGNGIFLSAALSNGASKAHGFELPGNEANRYIFSRRQWQGWPRFSVLALMLSWNLKTLKRWRLQLSYG